MARWDDLRRAIIARDTDAVERIWLELLEADPKDPVPFLEAADLCAKQSGGKRLAGSLLGLLNDHLTEKERWDALLPVLGRIAGYAPDDGTLRGRVIEVAQKAHPDRGDLEVLLEKSGVRGGTNAELETQAQSLRSLLQIEKDAWVFHKSGWGVGQIVEYDPQRGRCVIDFRTRPGHEMDVEAAAKLLERLDGNDIRVQAVADGRGLRKRAKEEPLEMIRQVLARYNNSCPLRNVREALVPDAVAPSTWSTWWKNAKKHALLDPRIDVGPGRDPRITFHDIAQADFQSQVDRAIKGQATAAGRQKAVMDLLGVVATNDEAKEILAAAAERELNITRDPAERVGWVIAHSAVTGVDATERLTEALALTPDPVVTVSEIPDDPTRAEAARALLALENDGPGKLIDLALRDDPAAARVAGEKLSKLGHGDLFEGLLDKIDARPAQYPHLYAWYCRGLKLGRWHGREYEAVPLSLRVLKVIDAVEYRARRGGGASDKKAVTRLIEILTDKNAKLVQEASAAADEDAAHHLTKMLGQNRGLKGRAREKLLETILREHPDALREPVHADREDPGTGTIYMTSAGMERWRSELDQIKNVEIPENAKEIARAREFGDLSENAEYHAAREKASLLQAKADALGSDLARAVAIQPEIVRTDAVSVGSRVRLRDGGGEELTYTLFGPPDTDVANGVINYLTPLGQALMGRGPGEHVKLDVDGDTRDLEVLSIENGLA
ncbi:MAG: GreA/GreB family elongation factor [Planctomycetota bacterium]|nr:GreA/GreB family elongation factor [Planctomycetota bacterium]